MTHVTHGRKSRDFNTQKPMQPENATEQIRAIGRVPRQREEDAVMTVTPAEFLRQPQKRNIFRGRFTGVEPGTDMIHIRLDHDYAPEFWAELCFSLGQLRDWLAKEGYRMEYQRECSDDGDDDHSI